MLNLTETRKKETPQKKLQIYNKKAERYRLHYYFTRYQTTIYKDGSVFRVINGDGTNGSKIEQIMDAIKK